MICSRCHLDKPAAEFAPSMLARGVGYCLPCRRKRYAENIEVERERGRTKARDPRTKAAKKAWANRRKLDPVARAMDFRVDKDYQLRRWYGIGLAEYESRMSAQGGVCACCSKPPPPGACLRVDHDHETGVVRGLICRNCNTAIGMLGDTAEGVARALRYLKGSGAHGRTNEAPGASPVLQ